MFLNLGCGGHAFPEPWVNIDRSLGTRSFPCHPDVLAHIADLPFGDESADAVYAGHVLEHLEYDECPAVAAEIRRVLKPGGRFAVVGPDMDRAVGDYAEYAPLIWPGMPGDWSTWEGAGHAYCSTAANTLPLLRPAFPDIAEIPIAELDPFWPTPSHDGWQFAFTTEPEKP